VTRKKQLVLGAAAVAVGAAVSAFMWLNREKPPADDPAPEAHSTPAAQSNPKDSTDPRLMGQVREAYQQSLGENAPPGMVELMEGRSGSGTLPPLPDPFVTPAGHHAGSGSSVELPPLPSDLERKSKPLPAPAAGKKPKEEPDVSLPPLPPPPAPNK
jgi:hypothetical protein